MRKTIFRGATLLILMLTATIGRSQSPATSAEFKRAFLNAINNTRQQGCNCGSKWMPPAPPLVWNTNLQKAAYGHAKDMNDGHYFSHDSKDGRSMQDRIVFAGYYFKGYQSFNVGENIAFGQQSIQQVMDEWFKSEGHCKNLMNPLFKEVGVVQYNDYWVQDFGGRVEWPPEIKKQIESGKIKVGDAVMTTHH
jgi:uncharacterized protein YkwD